FHSFPTRRSSDLPDPLPGYEQCARGSAPEFGQPVSGNHLAQGAIGNQIRNQEIDIHRLAIFPMTQRDSGTPAEVAVMLPQQVDVHRFKRQRDSLVMLPSKHQLDPRANTWRRASIRAASSGPAELISI